MDSILSHTHSAMLNLTWTFPVPEQLAVAQGPANSRCVAISAGQKRWVSNLEFSPVKIQNHHKILSHCPFFFSLALVQISAPFVHSCVLHCSLVHCVNIHSLLQEPENPCLMPYRKRPVTLISTFHYVSQPHLNPNFSSIKHLFQLLF